MKAPYLLTGLATAGIAVAAGTLVAASSGQEVGSAVCPTKPAGQVHYVLCEKGGVVVRSAQGPSSSAAAMGAVGR